MDNYQIDEEYLHYKYEMLQSAYDDTLVEIEQIKQKRPKYSKKVIVTRGYIKSVNEINKDRNKKYISDLEHNLKQYLKGIDYVNKEMQDLLMEKQGDMSYGFSDECELEWS